MASSHGYRAFGLNVASDFAMTQWGRGVAPWDVRIARGEVPAELAGAETLWDGAFQGRRGVGLLTYPEVGRILIEGGERITVDPAAGMTELQLSGVIAGTAFAALLYQRGGLCLHASAVAWRGKAYLIMGPSGAGKSTTASALLVRGCEFVSDDVTVVARGAGGEYCAVPSFPAVRLREDSHEVLGARINASALLDPVDQKIRLLYGGAVAAGPVPIARICFLRHDEAIAVPEAEQALGQERVGLVQRNFYRRRMGKIVGDPARLAEISINLARKAEVVRLARPSTGYALDELCRLVLGE